ncbi:hypothetical protein PENNAL_c0080G01149, partial [Penicillium nalgiovense]
MTLTNFKTDALEGLCTQEQLDLLDAFDTLRSQGISHYISLPQIIIASELPSLINEINSKINSCRSQLQKLGDPRATLDEQRLYLLHISQVFQTLVKAAVDGTYNESFFGDAKTDDGYRKRIRAVIQYLNQKFTDKIPHRGHFRHVL